MAWYMHVAERMIRLSSTVQQEKCESYLLFQCETAHGNQLRVFLYLLGLAYWFIGLSAITARFFESRDNIVEQTKEGKELDPITNTEIGTGRQEKVWNNAIADVTLLAFGTSFPQISLATIDAIRNLGQIYAGGLGPATLVGSAAFNLFPIHAVCVLVPNADDPKEISDIGLWLVELFWSFWAYVWLYIIIEVWTPNVVTLWEALLTVLQLGLLLIHAYIQHKQWPYLSLPWARTERPKDPRNDDSHNYTECGDGAGSSNGNNIHKSLSTIWSHQFRYACTVLQLGLSINLLSFYHESDKEKVDNVWKLIVSPWKFVFACVPPCHITQIPFICTLIFIGGIAYIVTQITDLISCLTGINPYVIAFTALAGGTTWPDLVASKIAAESRPTADSAIANITCSNSVNINVEIGVPWLIGTVYNFIVYREPLRIKKVAGFSFCLLMFFLTSMGCIGVLSNN